MAKKKTTRKKREGTFLYERKSFYMFLMTLLFGLRVLVGAPIDLGPLGVFTPLFGGVEKTSSAPSSAYGSISKTATAASSHEPKESPVIISGQVSDTGGIDISSIDLFNVPESHYVELGPADFSESEWNEFNAQNPYRLGALDAYGRATRADAYLHKSLYRGSQGREAIPVDPVGWNNPLMNNGDRPMNRSHLLAYAFMKADIDVAENLVSGLEEFNQSKEKGMQKFEKEVEYAVKSGFEVRYQVIPVYYEMELVPRGVVMRYQTHENSLNKTVFVYNVQDNLVIDYQNGDILQDLS